MSRRSLVSHNPAERTEIEKSISTLSGTAVKFRVVMKLT